jgi:2-haloacid dehalogenase
MQLTDFSTLTFDCYGTLIDWETGLLQAMQPWRERNRIAHPDATVLEAFGDAEARAQARTPGKLYPEILADALQTMASRWKVDVSDEELRMFGASVGDWPAFADSAQALVSLKQHYRLAILSNVDQASFALSNCKLNVAFDHVFTAQDIGSYKPDRRNFEYALERLRREGVEPNQVLHVAQSLFHDHAPAKQLGLATVWVNRRSGRPGTGATPPAVAVPDWEVASLADLVALHRRSLG